MTNCVISEKIFCQILKHLLKLSPNYFTLQYFAKFTKDLVFSTFENLLDTSTLIIFKNSCYKIFELFYWVLSVLTNLLSLK